MPEARKLPGGPIPEWGLFEPAVKNVGGKIKMEGFKAPDGRYFRFEDDEELVHVQSGDGKKRETFIKTLDGKQVPFEEWAQRYDDPRLT